jgi:peptidoglycan/xylan/chitin deacetylase (PgdA/CDA1 family)
MKPKMPVVLTFDVDGETLWLCRDPENAKRPVSLSLGRYGLIEGVPRILRLLERYDIPATFFVPGMIAERYTETIRGIAGRGHEIGNHSYSHTYPDKLPSKEAEREELQRTNEILKSITGKIPDGYRSPAWEFSEHTLDLLLEMGFTYSSNMMHTDESGSWRSSGERRRSWSCPYTGCWTMRPSGSTASGSSVNRCSLLPRSRTTGRRSSTDSMRSSAPRRIRTSVSY